MIRGSLRDGADGRVLIAEVLRTTNLRERTAGLLALPPLQHGQGLLLDRFGSIHTCFMPYRIDIVFLDRRLMVRKLVGALRPWRSSACWRSSSTLELPAGTIETIGLRTRQSLQWEQA